MIQQTTHPARRYLRYAVPVLALLALVGIWLYVRLFSGQVLACKASTDGKYVAEYRFYYQTGGATVTHLKGVEIRTRFNPLRHTIIDALDYGGDLTVNWIDSRNLLITCPNSGGKLDFYGGDKTSWHDVTIHYDLGTCQMLH